MKKKWEGNKNTQNNQSKKMATSFVLSLGLLGLSLPALGAEWIVKFKDNGPSILSQQSQLEAAGFQSKSQLHSSGLFLVEDKNSDLESIDLKALAFGASDKEKQKMTSDLIKEAALSKLDIEFIEENQIYHTMLGAPRPDPKPPGLSPVNRTGIPTAFPNDQLFGNLWGLNNTGQGDSSGQVGIKTRDIWAPQAWDLFTGSKRTMIAVIDTGVDISHPDLVDNLARDRFGKVLAFDASNPGAAMSDGNGHGTHCAGTIGAKGNNGIGVTGVNWDASIMPIKFMDDSGRGDLASAIRGIYFAVDNGAKVLSNSWGGGGFSQALQDAVHYAEQKGALFIAAAGNDSNNNDLRATFPAGYEVSNVISVGATDNQDQLANFSNYGTRTVDIAAPGVGIASTYPGGRYASLSGTSMATPHVAGAVALFWSDNPGWSAAQVKDQLLNSADRLSTLTKKISGGKRLNIYRMLSGG